MLQNKMEKKVGQNFKEDAVLCRSISPYQSMAWMNPQKKDKDRRKGKGCC